MKLRFLEMDLLYKRKVVKYTIRIIYILKSLKNWKQCGKNQYCKIPSNTSLTELIRFYWWTWNSNIWIFKSGFVELFRLSGFMNLVFLYDLAQYNTSSQYTSEIRYIKKKTLNLLEYENGSLKNWIGWSELFWLFVKSYYVHHYKVQSYCITRPTHTRVLIVYHYFDLVKSVSEARILMCVRW